MAPTLVCAPFHRAGWVFEEKVDGWRMLAYRTARAFVWSAATTSTTHAGSATSRKTGKHGPGVERYHLLR
jgi:hypothetical protein